MIILLEFFSNFSSKKKRTEALKMCSTFVLSVICVIAHFVIAVRAIGPLGAFGVSVGSSKCDPSITTASGTYAIHKGKRMRGV